MKISHALTHRSWIWMLGTSLSLAVGCSDDEKPGPGGQGGSGGMASGGTGGSTADAGGDATTGGASAGGMGGASAAPVVFEIPADGGEVEVTLPSGNSVEFDFPASAAGTTVTLTPASASSIGWPDGHFDEVIRMEPDGLQFDEPVEIRPSTGGVLVFDYPSSGSKSPAEGLPLNAAGDALELRHFSTLVVVPPDVSCDSDSGWVSTPNHEACAEHGAASTYLEYRCDSHSYCLLITASCCAEPGTEQCELGLPELTLRYNPVASAADEYPYCDSTGEGGGGAGGAGAAGGAGGAGGAVGGAGGAGGEGGSGGEGGAGGGPAALSSEYELTVLDIDATYAYFGRSGALWRTPLDGSGSPEDLLDGQSLNPEEIQVSGSYLYIAHSAGLARMPLAGGTLEELVTDAPTLFQTTSLDLDASTIYFTGSGYDPTLTSYVGSVPIGGGTLNALLTGEAGPDHIIVAGTVLHYANATGSGNHDNALMSMTTAGASPTDIIPGAGPVGGMVYGSQYAFYYTSDDGVYMAEPGIGTPSLVTAATNPGALSLSPDGKTLYFFEGAEIRTVPTSGGTSSFVADANNTFEVKTDGSYVYFLSMYAPTGLYRIAAP